MLWKHVRNLFPISLVSEWPCTITAMEGKGGPEEVRSEEKEEDSKEGEKKEEEAKEDVISLHGKEEEGLQRKCLTGWINYQLSRHPRPPQGRVTDILHDLRSGLLLISLLEVGQLSRSFEQQLKQKMALLRSAIFLPCIFLCCIFLLGIFLYISFLQ